MARLLAAIDITVLVVLALVVFFSTEDTARMVSGPACGLFLVAYLPLTLLTARRPPR